MHDDLVIQESQYYKCLTLPNERTNQPISPIPFAPFMLCAKRFMDKVTHKSTLSDESTRYINLKANTKFSLRLHFSYTQKRSTPKRIQFIILTTAFIEYILISTYFIHENLLINFEERHCSEYISLKSLEKMHLLKKFIFKIAM